MSALLGLRQPYNAVNAAMRGWVDRSHSERRVIRAVYARLAHGPERQARLNSVLACPCGGWDRNPRLVRP